MGPFSRSQCSSRGGAACSATPSTSSEITSTFRLGAQKRDLTGGAERGNIEADHVATQLLDSATDLLAARQLELCPDSRWGASAPGGAWSRLAPPDSREWEPITDGVRKAVVHHSAD